MAHITSIGAGVFSDFVVASPLTDLTNIQLDALKTSTQWQALFAAELVTGVTGAVGTYSRIKNVREFPSIGAPANIVNVAQFGSKASKQINGQADAPSIELTVNLIAADWDNTVSMVAKYLNDGKNHAFRFSLLNSQPQDYGIGSLAVTPAGVVPTTAANTSVPVGTELTFANAAAMSQFSVGQRLATVLAPTVSIGRITAISATGVKLDTAYTTLATVGAMGTLSGLAEVANSQWFFYGKIEALLINPQLTDANTATLTISVASDFFGPFTTA